MVVQFPVGLVQGLKPSAASCLPRGKRVVYATAECLQFTACMPRHAMLSQ